jgi:DNA-binding FadR family transcriptional regulator
LARIGLESAQGPAVAESTTIVVPVDAARGSAWIADQLRQAIIEGTYKFGQKLPAERQLAEAFNASRTTVRLALDRLEMDKLVARRIGSGTFVSFRHPGETDDIAEITSPIELIEARLAMEPYMTRLAVLNAAAKDLEKLFEACDLAEAAGNDAQHWTEWDTQFHIRIAEASHNPLMLWIYRRVNEIRAHDQWAAMRDKVLTPQRIADYNHQHRALAEAIASRDVEGAVAMVTSHLHYARRQLMGAEGSV